MLQLCLPPLRSHDGQTFPHNTYSLNPAPSVVQYSSLGTRGTHNTDIPVATYDVIDMNSAPSQSQGREKSRHVVEGTREQGKERGGEGDYHLLMEVGGDGEALTSTIPPPATQQVAETMNKEYSRLKYH